MVDRNLVHDLLVGIQERLLHERLAHAMSRASAEREFAFELAALIEEHVRDVVAIPPWQEGSASLGDAGEARSADADLLVLPRSSARPRRDGTLAAPEVWPPQSVAIEIVELRLANGVSGPRGYDAVLERLERDIREKSAHACAAATSWVGLSVMTDAAWTDAPLPAGAGSGVAAEVRVDRWRACAPGLRCIGSVFGRLSYRAFRGDVWVEAFVQAPGDPAGESAGPSATCLRVPPPATLAPNERDAVAWYATHGAGDLDLSNGVADAFGPTFLRVETAALHEHRRDQYERSGRWGGTFDELRLSLFMEERLRRQDSAASLAGAAASLLSDQPGVAELLAELRAAWSAP